MDASENDVLIQVAKPTKPSYGTSDSTVIFCVHGNPDQTCCDDISFNPLDRPKGISITKREKAHCHAPRDEGIDKKARKKLIIASILCVVFMILEVIGGILSNSLAIATDAAHLLTDFASFMISLFALWIASRPSTTKMSFGWHRAEVLGALISVLMIWVLTAILVFLAAKRVINDDFELNPMIMLITSFLGIVVNIIMGCTLHQHGHTHAKDDENYSGRNINVHAAFIHVLGDFLQSFGVFIAAIIIYFMPHWKIADPICTFIFSVLVMFTTFQIIKDALLVLMEGTPKYLDYTDVMKTFLEIDGVVRVHNLRIWALTLNKVALSAHLAIRADAQPETILEVATRTVHGKYHFFESTIQIEIYQPEMEDCGQCENPLK